MTSEMRTVAQQQSEQGEHSRLPRASTISFSGCWWSETEDWLSEALVARSLI
ncbi:hypothetical protein OK016_00450 [Vibrio chagasii]|nr:hypothetical protein [Vibrio chagasii]